MTSVGLLRFRGEQARGFPRARANRKKDSGKVHISRDKGVLAGSTKRPRETSGSLIAKVERDKLHHPPPTTHIPNPHPSICPPHSLHFFGAAFLLVPFRLIFAPSPCELRPSSSCSYRWGGPLPCASLCTTTTTPSCHRIHALIAPENHGR